MALVVVLAVATVVEVNVASDILVSVAVVLCDVPVVLGISESVLELEIVDSLDVAGNDVIVEAVSVLMLPTLLLAVSAAEDTVGVVVDDSVLPIDKVETIVLEVVASVELELVLLGMVDSVVILSLSTETVLLTVELVVVLSLGMESELVVLSVVPFKQRKKGITHNINTQIKRQY